MNLEFKQYTGTKTIQAMPMTKAEAETLLGKSITPAVPCEDGYLVEYPDGYRSWCPAPEFLAAYRISETHADRMAIELEDLGRRICKATDAIYSKGAPAMTKEERNNLSIQLEIMRKYFHILNARYLRARERQAHREEIEFLKSQYGGDGEGAES